MWPTPTRNPTAPGHCHGYGDNGSTPGESAGLAADLAMSVIVEKLSSLQNPTAPTPTEQRTGAVQHPHRFLTLDLLRGIAALVVVYFHTHALFGPNIFQHGYLAVDFFFMLSGFVLMSAYGQRLDAGWPTFTFMKARFARLYPLYFLGLTLTFVFLTAYYLLSRQHVLAAPVLLYVLGLGFVPVLFGPGGPSSYLYPLNTPTWSLFFELAVNLFQATLLRRRSQQTLFGIALASALVLAVSVLHLNTLELGPDRATFAYGFIRVIFSYTTGMLLYSLWERGTFRLRWPVIASALALVLLLGAPVPPTYAGLYDLAATLVGFPLLVLLSASAVPPRRLAGLCILLGNASYAIYVLHVPASAWLHELATHTPLLKALQAPWIGMCYLTAIVTISILLDRIYDLPARAFLRKHLHA